jgi:hypothetical protein
MRPRPTLRLLPISVAALCCLQVATAQEKGPGYTDTPRLPSGWRVHDAERPRPPAVTPAPAGTPAPAPADAVVLFDGKDLSPWLQANGKEPARWKVQDGYMEVNGTGDIRTKGEFGDVQLHVEWMAPAEVKGDSQGRGNSGVFLFGMYEIQVLDSYDNPSYADGQAAALYGQYPPLVNACRKPGEWQTYDIIFVAPRFADDGSVVSPARVTVVHNGIAVQIAQEMLGPSRHRALTSYRKHGDKGSIRLQDHGNPVRFRNIWLRELNCERPAPPAVTQDQGK